MAKYSAKRQLGNIGEDAACRYLERKGYRIILRNYLRPWGEIDIIAEKGGSVRFVEVKSISRATPHSHSSGDVARENNDYRPEEQVHPAKLKKLSRTAEMYMNEQRDTRDYQIDVVGVYIDMGQRIARCRLYEQVL